ncbi:MAG: hypothetical protein V4685_19495 [Bacteroidota bacterium]
MKKTFLSLFIVCIVTCCAAQPDKEYTFNAGAEIGYATGDFNANHKLGFAVSVQGEYSFSEAASVTASVGFLSFATKTLYDTLPSGIFAKPQPSFTGVPLLVGLKFNIADKMYGHPQAGLVFVNSVVASTYSMCVGMQTSPHVDFSLRYQSIIKARVIGSFIMARAAYVF